MCPSQNFGMGFVLQSAAVITVCQFYICIYLLQILVQANCAVCKADVSGATALSSSAASADMYGTQSIGIYGKIRSRKAVRTLCLLRLNFSDVNFFHCFLFA